MDHDRKKSVLFLVCLLLVYIFVPHVSLAAAHTYEGAGWATPEEAVQFYLEGLKEQDLNKMISAYAVETVIDHFDLQAQLFRMRMYSITMTPRLPNTNNLLRGINVEGRKNEIVQSILWQITSISMPGEDFAQPAKFGIDIPDEAIVAFAEDLDHSFNSVDFSTLKVLRFTPPEAISEQYASERNRENIKAQIAPYGADEARSMVAAFTVDDKVCVLCCDVARYGDRWFMFKPNGNIGAMIGLSTYSGGVVAVDQEALSTLRETSNFDEQEILEALLMNSL